MANQNHFCLHFEDLPDFIAYGMITISLVNVVTDYQLAIRLILMRNNHSLMLVIMTISTLSWSFMLGLGAVRQWIKREAEGNDFFAHYLEQQWSRVTLLVSLSSLDMTLLSIIWTRLSPALFEYVFVSPASNLQKYQAARSKIVSLVTRFLI